MTAVLMLNVVFAGFVLGGVLSLLGWAIVARADPCPERDGKGSTVDPDPSRSRLRMMRIARYTGKIDHAGRRGATPRSQKSGAAGNPA
jgi:hypothetical protein